MPDEKKEFLKQLLLQQLDLLHETKDTADIAKVLDEQRSSDIAEVVELLDNEERRIIFDILDKPTCAEVLEKVDEATRAEMFEMFEDDELAGLVSHLDADDAADILSELPETDARKILKAIPPQDSAEIKKLMLYSEDSAGGIMDPVLICVDEDATVAEAVSKIRAAEIDEDFYSVYVVDKSGRFVGDVRLRLLLTRPEDSKLSSLIDSDTIYVNAQADQEEVRNIFRNNDLIVVPVLDENHRLIGRITADRVIEVAEEEAVEDMYTMAGTDPDELENVSIIRAARIRMTWLLPCLVGTGVTALVMMFFRHNNPGIFIVAAAFVPMIAAISGNAGLQTSAIVVTGLATGHLAALNLSQVFNREVRIAFMVALSCGVLGGVACAVLLHIIHSENVHAIKLVTAFAAAMFSAIMVATTLGLFLPFLFRKVGIDPAISSGPLVTTANDSISVAIYMTLAILLAS